MSYGHSTSRIATHQIEARLDTAPAQPAEVAMLQHYEYFCCNGF
jgi:hypothetical protein